MNQENYHCSFTANNTVKEAFDSITRVSEWWTGNLEGSSNNLNDLFTVRFGETSSLIKIVEWVPDKKIVWQVVDCHLHFLKNKKEWKDTRLLWEVLPDGDATQVRMTHIGLVPALECYANCKDGWNYYVKTSLFELLTRHKGRPDTDKAIAREKIDMNRPAPRAVADPETGLILATVDVALPPQRVFRALTQASEIEHWWGAPDVYRMTQWIADFRVGGRYSVVVVRPDGSAYPASGTFLEIDAPHKLVHTRKYEWDHPVLGRRETTIAYRFDPLENGTRVTVRHEGFVGCEAAAYEHAEGWVRVLGWLDAYLFYQFYFPKN
ncbi:MAG TPA: SRPBCC family protein [Puia sp.]|jgi:uncharacterized protein YndB with AHSA1/START domain|nr:SRPBCC family protein [Puia sp.]